MPVYEYVCESCGHEFEELTLSMADADGQRCPACSSDRVTRKLSVFAARQGASKPADLPAGGPCGTCSYRDGPCSMQPG